MPSLYLAGYGNSEPLHWQTLWRKADPDSLWLDHRSWERPEADEWVGDLARALGDHPGPWDVVAHSLGCLLVSDALLRPGGVRFRRAFLVAVPNPTSPYFPEAIRGFTDPFQVKLSFPTLIVASRNDPYGSFAFSERLAGHWGSGLVDAGEKGHLNLASGLGAWDEGRRLRDGFLSG